MVQGCTRVGGLRDHIVDPCCVWVWELFTVRLSHTFVVTSRLKITDGEGSGALSLQYGGFYTCTVHAPAVVLPRASRDS